MKEYQSLSHTRWDCKYHLVFIPKRRKKRVFEVLRRQLGEIFHELASHKESKIVEGHMMADHVHMQCSRPGRVMLLNTATGAGGPDPLGRSCLDVGVWPMPRVANTAATPSVRTFASPRRDDGIAPSLAASG